MNEESIFAEAITKPRHERSAYLDRVCGDNGQLRSRVDALLAAHDDPDVYLDDPLRGVDATADPPIAECAGSTIGLYRLREKIGEGGMGVVFVAEQEHPVRRKVALKVIKPGMDTKEVVARFEAERQALALMDHPNIAKVYDAGTTDSGHPYFVMELVRGVPVTEYCDKQKLSVPDRLELFILICHAVQHAHQKGIIHRDIKPTNVLAADQDGKPVPKVIDFGVAKAINQRLTERTVYTRLQQIIGTPVYMSPEQAEFGGLDVDTRSDVYSLGVLLYELLSGTTPFDKERFARVAYDEIRRIIRDEDPPKPSTRISSLGATASSVSLQRQTDPQKLCQMVRGDLDWIVVKALDKDRTRRYSTASALGDDIKRYLDCAPVEACPPSTAYRLRKFIRRNKGLVAAVLSVMLALLTGMLGTSVAAAWAVREARLAADLTERLTVINAAAKADNERLYEALDQLRDEVVAVALNAVFSGNHYEANEAIKRAGEAGAPPDLVHTLRGITLLMEGRIEDAIKKLEEARRLDPSGIKTNAALFWAHWQGTNYGKMDEIRQQLVGMKWPQGDYDQLFLSIVRQAAGNTESLREMDLHLTELIGRHPQWGIAYALRSQNRMELAMETKNISDFMPAVQDLVEAQKRVPGSPFIESGGLYSLTVAIELGRSLGKDSQEWQHMAADLARHIEDREGDLTGKEHLARYLYLTDQVEEARQLESCLVEIGKGGMCPRWAVMFEENRLEALEAELRRESANLDTRINLAFLLATKSPEGRREARQIIREVIIGQPSLTHIVLATEVSLMLGDIAWAREIASTVPADRRWAMWRWWDYNIDYYADVINETELLRRAGPFSNAGCLAYYAIGMKSLARGERKKAQEYFLRAAKTQRVSWYPYHWGRSLAHRMEQDPQFPDWIESSLDDQ